MNCDSRNFFCLPALLLAACALDPTPAERSSSLLSAESVPDVLVESAELALRPSTAGNRFVAGWWPLRRDGRLHVVAGEDESARLELVHLPGESPRSRTLALELLPASEATAVDVWAAGRPLGSFATEGSVLRMPLPEDLPEGRVLVELRPRGGPLRVLGGGVRPARTGGGLTVEDAVLVQTGPSAVDVVRPVRAGTTLEGRLEAGGAEDGFALRIESPEGVWSTVESGGGEIRVELKEGFVRVRLLAPEQGVGRWALSWVEPWHDVPESSVPEPPATVLRPDEVPEVVVLYVLDALRADTLTHLGGLPGTTPTIDRLASEGFTFRSHRSHAPNTLPSTKALLTGEAQVDRGGWKLPPDGPVLLAERFRRAGFRTALFSGNVYVGPTYGVDRGFEHVVEEEVREVPWNDNAERLHAAVLDYLADLGPDERVFLYVHVIHPHNPYAPPPEIAERFTAGLDGSAIDGRTATLLDIRARRRDVDTADQERLQRLYAANLAYSDAALATLVAALDGWRGDRRMLLAVTSDHGEELFEHGGLLHGYTLYDEMIRIPLVVHAPGIVVPGETSAMTGTLDLHATLAVLAGAGELGEGRSLWPLLRGVSWPPQDVHRPSVHPPYVHLGAAASTKGIFSAQTERWKLVWAPRQGVDWGVGGGPGRSRSPEYLFHLAEDPGETVNRAGEGGLEAAWLRSRLLAWIAAKQHAGEDGEGDALDDETRRRLEALGYLQ